MTPAEKMWEVVADDLKYPAESFARKMLGVTDDAIPERAERFRQSLMRLIQENPEVLFDIRERRDEDGSFWELKIHRRKQKGGAA